MSETSFVHYDRTVIGFHGTDPATADRLIRGDRFEPSARESEWLGTGIYFWEHAPKQAWHWARSVRKYSDSAVVGAVFCLGNRFDLFDPGNTEVLLAFKDTLIEELVKDRKPVPTNHRKHKALDCAVFNCVSEKSIQSGRRIESYRAMYVPADRYKRVWKGSWINVETHVQICVTNPENILAVWSVKVDGSYSVDP